jgi:hypothetical protein
MALALADKTNADIVVGTWLWPFRLLWDNNGGFAERQSNYDFDDCFPTWRMEKAGKINGKQL